jgi:hypothetical protein
VTDHQYIQEFIANEQLRDWAWFLTTAVPSLSANGAIQCIQLVQALAPSGGPTFGLLLQSQALRQQIMLAATSSPSKAPEINPHAMAQLAQVLNAHIDTSIESH